MEIERKYLINEIPFELNDFDKEEIKQAYLSKMPVKRIRQLNDKYYYTEKSNGQVIREEIEKEITEEKFNELSLNIITKFLRKTRYLIPIDNCLIAELDIYHNSIKGLMTVEVEFKSIDEANQFVPPYWFGKDVSLESKYKNSNLPVYTD